ncbi:Os09g0325140 [Oryza sativa Japonica Group]|uniref:Os09g0325140 protein n=1 Tax=Oryza sativa subsp. japonica TaxID=39947 RepID=C7J728_ORYSJ|nr:Os09g0325140 [Oryza sativa Japonica Group]|eukprot:NP_001175772.1 Os09g0325140 [Oryza sativa Japonica Group]
MLATHHADEIPAGFEFEDCVVRECMPPTTDEVPAGFESEDFVVIVDGVGGLILSLPALLIGACAAAAVAAAGDGCRAGCSLAIAAYYFSEGSNLTFIATIFAIGGGGYQALLPYNPAITNPDYVVTGDRVFVFPCSCLGLPAAPASTFLAGAIPYPLPLPRGGGGDTYDAVAANFANLTTAAWLEATRAGSPAMEGVSPRYGLFLTYPLWDGETLESVAAQYGFSSPAEMELIRRYNPGMGGVSGKGIVFIPVKDPNGSYHPLKSGVGIVLLFCELLCIYAKFEEALSAPNPTEALDELIDPSLRGDYPVDSALTVSSREIASLAKSCTHEEPGMRPTMRSVVVALMALTANTDLRDMDYLPPFLRTG